MAALAGFKTRGMGWDEMAQHFGVSAESARAAYYRWLHSSTAAVPKSQKEINRRVVEAYQKTGELVLPSRTHHASLPTAGSGAPHTGPHAGVQGAPAPVPATPPLNWRTITIHELPQPTLPVPQRTTHTPLEGVLLGTCLGLIACLLVLLLVASKGVA